MMVYNYERLNCNELLMFINVLAISPLSLLIGQKKGLQTGLKGDKDGGK